MTIDNLYQKRHGIPGVGFSSGKNGLDGEGGNNVYFGYVNEFFKPNGELTSYNLVRIAQTAFDSSYYTGVFKVKEDGSIGDIIPDVSGHFVEIMEDPLYPTRYTYTFDSSNVNMKMYVKVDVNEIGRDATAKKNENPYNIGENEASVSKKWEHIEQGEYPWNAPVDDASNPYIPPIPTGIYPYVAYKGTLESIQTVDPSNYANIRPGSYNLSQSDLNGFELFSIKTASATYQFAYIGKDTGTYDPSVYTAFEDSSINSMDDPSISQVGVAYAHPEDTSILRVDFIKYSEKLNETIEVLDELADFIVAGDIIYFYTDKGDFELNETVRYMTVITKELEGCS
jgi:hypothetical protein